MAVYINLPIEDPARSRAFFTGLGYAVNETFTDDKAIAIELEAGVNLMLLSKPFFQTFTPRGLADANTVTEVLVALSLPDRASVDAMVAKAVSLGGKIVRPPEDHGFMYGHAFADLDGHIWEPHWLDPAVTKPQAASNPT